MSEKQQSLQRFLETHPHYNEYMMWKRRLKNAHKNHRRENEEVLDYEEYLEKIYAISPEQLPFYIEKRKKIQEIQDEVGKTSSLLS